MFRLAHISDLHLGPLPDVSMRQLASKRITGYVNWRVNRHHHHGAGTVGDIMADIAVHRPSHIALTGDLINLGLDSEIEQARDWLADHGDPETLSVIPGNHDAYVPGAFNHLCDAWRPWMEGDGPVAVQAQPFPYMRVRADVAIIGVSSARATAPFMATGFFRNRQALATAALLREAGREGLCRVIMIHHPPLRGATAFHKRLVGIDRFQQVVRENGAELVLHGHTHLPTLGWIDGVENRVPVVGVAAAFQGFGGLRPPAQYNLISIEGKAGDWRIGLERRGIDRGHSGIGRITAGMLEPDGFRSDAELGHQV